MTDTKSKTTSTTPDEAVLPPAVDTIAEAEDFTPAQFESVAYDVTDFEKRRAALELALTANSADPLKTAGEFYTFLSTAPTDGAA